MVKNQRNSCCHMGCPPMFVHLHFHRGYSLGPQKSKPLIIYGIVSTQPLVLTRAGYGPRSRGMVQGSVSKRLLCIPVASTSHGRGSQESLCPILMGREETKE